MAERPRNLKRITRLPVAADAVSQGIVRDSDIGIVTSDMLAAGAVTDAKLANDKVNVAGDTMTGELEVPSLVVNGGTSLAGILSTTAVLDFGSISAQSSAELTVTLTGAAIGDIALLGPPDSAAADISFFAFVSATDTVTVRAVNATAGSVDPASGTYRVAVLQF